MSGKSAKLSRRTMRKESSKIKIEGLEEFLLYASAQRLRRRLAFAARIIFKRVV